MAEEEAGPSNIRVICRFRPINEKEKILFADNQCVEFPNDNKTVIINPQSEQGGPHNFVFDYVFTPSAEQVNVYNIAAKPIVEAVMLGFNGTVFAYGQTSSGKTFTMTGPDMTSPELMGIIPRMVSTVFDKIESADAKIEFQVKVGYCEIYLEKIKDLLDPSKVNLKVHEDRTRGVYIADLSEEYVSTGDEVYQLMKIGTDNREVAFTNMNAGSSRSHSIFILTITQTNSTDYSAKTGKLYLVDLAGSEKVGKTGAAGKRLEEAKTINKSLTMLGSVITALTDGKSSHVPYRDSKLTRVLQDSLGGNSKTSLIVTCSPSPFNEAETVSTLRFGVRAKAIKNKPKVNREYTVHELKIMLAQAKDEIAKKDRVILSMKKAMEGSGISANFEERIKRDEDEQQEEERQDEEEKKNGIYEEILMELEDVKLKLDEELKINKKIRMQIEQLVLDNNELESDHEFIYKQIRDLQDRLMQSEEALQLKEDTIEKLNITNDMLKGELALEFDKKSTLENKLSEKSEKESETEDHYKNLLKKTMEENNALRNTLHEETMKIEMLTRNLNDEAMKNDKLCEEIDELKSVITASMKGSKDNAAAKKLEDLHKQEKDRWQQEKKSLVTELNSRVKKVVELQLQLEGETERFKALESTMSDGERVMKKRSDTLERNLEQLNLMYHQLVSQKSMLKVDKQVCDRKVARLNDKLISLDKSSKECNEKILVLEKENNALREELKEIKQSKMRMTIGPGMIAGTKIKKIIKGGGENTIFRTPASSRRTVSVVPESLQENEEEEVAELE